MNNQRKIIHNLWLIIAFIAVTLLLNGYSEPTVVIADEPEMTNQVIPLEATIVALSNSWLSLYSPFRGDVNENNYSDYDYGTSATGPWTPICLKTGGESLWRYCAFSGLTANTDYYVRVTFTDPDGVNGPNPQIVGPTRTNANVNNLVSVSLINVKMRSTYLLVTTSILNDSNQNSREIVEVATAPNGTWTVKCGPRVTFAPKLCRIHGLSKNTNYWVRVTVTDPDGVSGINPQLLGPFLYNRYTNLALGKPVTADAGWGCCSTPTQLVDGLIQYPDWPYGFAWCGGSGHWCGIASGWKQATIDLQSVQTINRVDWWTHDPGNVPITWKIEVSLDGINYVEVFFNNEPRCRTETESFVVSWSNPSCGHHAIFDPTPTRYVRYSFDDHDLFNGVHGWAVELEVFGR